eukprot:jgi/Tetstr1/441435/TSEL_029681.t1
MVGILKHRRQLRARAAALDGQLEKQREATSQLLDYCDSFQFVLDARERQLGGQRRALSRLHSSGGAELAAAERRADEAEVAATFLQQQVDDLSGKLADSEAAATARVADLANELKQARELKAASERLAHEVTDAGDATMSESHQGKVHGGVLESKQMASNQLEKKRKFQQDCLGWMHKMMRKHDENCPPAL